MSSTTLNPPPPGEKPSPAGAAPPRRFLSRDQVLALGRQGDPYAFVPLALEAIRQAQAAGNPDPEMRFTLAAAYARLMLRTAALQELDQLTAMAPGPAVSALRDAAARLPGDEIQPAELERALRASVDTLESRGITLGGVDRCLELWRERARGLRFYRARSSAAAPGEAAAFNIVAQDEASPRWAHWPGDAEANARRAGAELAVMIRKSPRPITIEGLNPPNLFRAIFSATPDPGDGHRIPITIVQRELGDLLFGLAIAGPGIAAELAEPRISVFVGPDASTRLASDLRSRLDTQVLGPVYTNVSAAAACAPSLGDVFSAVQREQVERQESLRARVSEIYARRDAAWWAARYEQIRDKSGERKPRVLIPTCRYTTFVQHSARDIARAFDSLGWETRILIEPDEFSRLSSVAYLGAYADFDPDLVVLINYTRRNLGDVSPPNVPFVCWVQDAMPHLYDASIGAAQTPFDFLAGHAREELFSRYGYPRQRAAGSPVLVSTEKFHDGPIDAALLAKHECEVAYVSHHSRAPEELHAQLAGEAALAPDGRRMLDGLFEAVKARVADCAGKPLLPALRADVRRAASEALFKGAEPSPELVTRLFNNYACPIADRLIRHEMLHWAADICDRRRWRLRIYGKGWDAHPRFRAFAHPTLEHGEQLRASYRAARIHLHASVHWNYHQRVMECAASGGLPACRLKFDDLNYPRYLALDELWRSGAAHSPSPQFPGAVRFDASDGAHAMAFIALRQRLGVAGASDSFLDARPDPGACRAVFEGLPLERDAALLMGDPAQSMFWSRESLEALIERAVDRGEGSRASWRDDLSQGIAARVRRHFTYRPAAERIVDLVGRTMSREAGSTRELAAASPPLLVDSPAP